MNRQQSIILVIDDIPLNIKMLMSILELDYEVLFALDAQKGLQLACSEKPDLILLDIMMPECDGYQTCEKLKSDPQTRNIPVIFVSALITDEDEERGLKAGAIDYISKPFNPMVVKSRIKNHLDLKQSRDQLERLSCVDELTKVANRRRFDEFLQQSWRSMLRESKPISAIMIDIDYFKYFNDHYGHIAGDLCLQQVAEALDKELSRPEDLVARYGGEEFVCILPETDLEGAKRVAENLRHAVSNLKIHHRKSQISTVVTASLGLSTVIPTTHLSALDLINSADQALYHSKSTGRNKVSVRELNLKSVISN